MTRPKILLIVGSLNQTTQMHQIAKHLMPVADCYFTQYFSNSWLVNLILKTGLLDRTILGGTFKEQSTRYLLDHQLEIDDRGKQHLNDYELVFTCSDLIVPSSLKHKKMIWVQEGMIDPYTRLSYWIHKLKLPRYLAKGTSLNGSSNACDLYCVASEGFKTYLSEKGTNEGKIKVTGIPNFDDFERLRTQPFEHKGYFMVATSDIRECFGQEDRIGFLKMCVQKADGKQLLIKLHPNEMHERAIREIQSVCPSNTLIYTHGNASLMVAHAAALQTQYSTLTWIGICLGIPTYSFLDIAEIQQRMPIQNRGLSAQNIANLALEMYLFPKSTRGKSIQNLQEELLTQEMYV